MLKNANLANLLQPAAEAQVFGRGAGDQNDIAAKKLPLSPRNSIFRSGILFGFGYCADQDWAVQ
jgi:hypothetical protein